MSQKAAKRPFLRVRKDRRKIVKRHATLKTSESERLNISGSEIEDPPLQPQVALASGKGQSATTKVVRVFFVLINLVIFAFGLFLIIRGSMEYYYYKGELGFWSTSVGRILKDLGQDYHFVETLNPFKTCLKLCNFRELCNIICGQ